MYNESKSVNLIGLIVKIIIVVIFVLLAIWLISNVANKTSKSAFEKNMNVMRNASIEYFKKGNLPEEEGIAKKVTLEDLIKMKYIASFDKKCDRKKSFSQATLVDDYYALRVELLCSGKRKYIYTSIDKDGNCIGDNCSSNDNKTDKDDKDKNDKTTDDNDYKNKEKIENDKNGKINNDSNKDKDKEKPKSEEKKLYYEHVRVNKVYTDWTYNKLTGNNVETKQENSTMNKYCKVYSSDYYVVAYYPVATPLGNAYKIVVRLDNLPSNTSYYVLSVSELFNNNISMYDKLMSTSPKTTFIVGNNGYGIIDNSSMLQFASLKDNNVSFINNNIYKGNNGIMIESWIKFYNYNGVYKCDCGTQKYFLPIHYVVKYADEGSCVKDLEVNSNKYNGYTVIQKESTKVTLYRSYSYKKDENDKKWSTDKVIDGYILTGKTEYR